MIKLSELMVLVRIATHEAIILEKLNISEEQFEQRYKALLEYYKKEYKDQMETLMEEPMTTATVVSCDVCGKQIQSEKWEVAIYPPSVGRMKSGTLRFDVCEDCAGVFVTKSVAQTLLQKLKTAFSKKEKGHRT